MKRCWRQACRIKKRANYSYNHNCWIFPKGDSQHLRNQIQYTSSRKEMCFFMIRDEFKEYKTIQTKDPQKFDLLLKEALDPIKLKNPEVTRFYDSEIGHCAYVSWEEKICEPENAKDEFELKGISYCCGECPLFVLQKDRRVKKSICNLGESTWYEKSACNELYEMIKEGKIEL